MINAIVGQRILHLITRRNLVTGKTRDIIEECVVQEYSTGNKYVKLDDVWYETNKIRQLDILSNKSTSE